VFHFNKKRDHAARRIILKAQTGVSLHERFTRFMKQRSSEEATLPKQTEPTLPAPSRSSDKNRRLALDLERRHNDIETAGSRAAHGRIEMRQRERSGDKSMSSRLGSRAGERRSRSPVERNGRGKGWQSVTNGSGGVKDRLGNGSMGTGVKDRLGKKSVKDRLDLPVQTISDRLGSKPMSERIELDKKPRIEYQYNSPPKSRGNKFESKGNFNTKSATGERSFNRGPVPDQDTLDKEMDDYMKKSKHGLDSMLDDYMKAAPKNSSKASQAAASSAPVATIKTDTTA